MTINIEVGLHYRFKVATAAQRTNMTDVLTDCIRGYVEKYEAGSKDKRGRR